MKYDENNEPIKEKKSLLRLTIIIPLIICLVIGGAIFVNTFAPVDAGYRGVLLEWGRPVTSLNEGWNWKSPIGQTVEQMNVQMQTATVKESTGTSDLQEAITTVTLNYHLDEDNAMWIYQNLRYDYVERAINPALRDGLKATTAKYTAEQLITQREDVKSALEVTLINKLQQFHIKVDAVSITEFTFSEQFQSAVDAKVKAEQMALEAKNKLLQIEYEAQQQVIQATANATAILTLANANANATVIAANATARAAEIISIQLTPEFLAYTQIQIWDGAYPVYYAGGNGTLPMLYIPADWMYNDNNSIQP